MFEPSISVKSLTTLNLRVQALQGVVVQSGTDTQGFGVLEPYKGMGMFYVYMIINAFFGGFTAYSIFSNREKLLKGMK